MPMGFDTLSLRDIQPVAGFSDFCRLDFLYSHAQWAFHSSLETSEHGTSVPGHRLSISSRPLPGHGSVHRNSTFALQATVHLARSDHCAGRHSGIFALETDREEFVGQ